MVVADTFRGWFFRIGSPATCDYGPAQLAMRVGMFVRGGPLYGDFRVPPYLVLPYGPVVPVMAAALSRLFGTGPLAALEGGRLLTIFSSLAVCPLIFLLARRFGVGRSASTIAALAFIVSPLVQIWGFEFRVDMPSLACQLGGLYLFQAGLEYQAVALFVGAFFIKQFRIAGITAVVLFCWLSGDRRRAVRLSAVWLAAIVLLTAILQLIFPFYLLNTFGTLDSPYDLGAVPRFFDDLLIYNPGLVTLAAMALIRRRALKNLEICFLLGALAQDAGASLHWGSNSYYFMTTLAALTFFAAEALDRLREQAARLTALAQAGISAAIVLALVPWWATAGHGLQHVYQMAHGEFGSTAKSVPWGAEALQRLKAIHGRVLTDLPDLALVNPSGNVEFLELPLGLMRAHGLFNDHVLIEEIEARKIGGFALDDQLLKREWRGRTFFWPELGQAVSRNYTLVRDPSGHAVGPPFLMVPKAGR